MSACCASWGPARSSASATLAAGTVVIREPRGPAAAGPVEVPAAGHVEVPNLGTVDGLYVTHIDATELAASRDFLSRRDALDDASRARVPDALAGRLSPKVGGVIPGSVGSEHILELVLAAKSRPGSEAR